jgi:hypothetical protein
MIPITNPKLLGLEPRWAPFRGFSLLFDPPADDTWLRALCAGVAELEDDALIAEHGLRLLPLPSYHVTVWDGVNDGKLAEVAPEWRAAWARFLQSIPTKTFPDDLFREVRASEVLACPDWDLRLRCARIENWSKRLAGGAPEPVDAAAAERLARLQAARATPCPPPSRRASACAPTRLRAARDLGYFANAELAATSAPAVARWNAALREKTAGSSCPCAACICPRSRT